MKIKYDFCTRWMIRADLPAVLDIERRNGASNTWATGLHWNEKDIITMLRQRNCIGIVAEVNEIVCGYCIYELHKMYLDIKRLQVHPEWQRCKVGSTFIEKLKSKLSHGRRVSLLCEEVPDYNIEMLAFMNHHKFGCAHDMAGSTYYFDYQLPLIGEQSG